MDNKKMAIREHFETAMMNMMSNPKYVNLSFYSFIIAKMKLEFDEHFPTLGVSFHDTMYSMVIGDFFTGLDLDTQIAVLVHECRHILDGHVFRKGKRNHELFNIACDIAINQTIKNIPESGMFPKTFNFPVNKTAEQYYEMLLKKQSEQMQEKQNAMENGEDWDGPSDGTPDLTPCQSDIEDCNGDENGGKAGTIDSHEGWTDDNIDEDLAKSITEKMVSDAIEKSMGNLPGDISEIIERWSSKAKISWKSVLRRYMATKPGSRISTIKRRDRRFPRRMDLRGKKTNIDTRRIIVGVDTSGSMSNTDIINGLNEIDEVCKLNNGDIDIIQVDVKIQGTEKFDNTNKNFVREGCGGTYMGAVPEFITKNKINCDVLIMISDMYIEDINTDSNWSAFNKPVIWLNTSGRTFDIPKHHKIFNIHDA